MGKHVSVGEVVTYTPHPENPETTLLTQQAVISIQGVPLIDHLERLLTMTIEQNANKVNDYTIVSLEPLALQISFRIIERFLVFKFEFCTSGYRNAL